MTEIIIVISLVVIAAIYLFRKLQKTFTQPYDGCSNCSCDCNSTDKCDTK